MLIHIPLRENPPTVTSQEKGEAIRYKWVIRNGKRVSMAYIHHFEKPEVARARGFYVRKKWSAEPYISIEIEPTSEAYE